MRNCLALYSVRPANGCHNNAAVCIELRSAFILQTRQQLCLEMSIIHSESRFEFELNLIMGSEWIEAVDVTRNDKP